MQMVDHIRAIFSECLKTNRNLEFAVVTGCLRIAKESIFTGLNNFKVRTISDVDCAEYFGFTGDEVWEMLRYYQIESRYEDFKEWYSSSNAIIQSLIEDSTETTKEEIETLISGGHIEKRLAPELTYTDLSSKDKEIRQTYLWSALFVTGYLTEAATPSGRSYCLKIPNKEILGIYEEKILSWFKINVTSKKGCKVYV